MRRFRRLFVPSALQRADLEAFRRVARYESPMLDRVLPRLSRIANHSLLWTAIAAGLWLSGRRSFRRAGLRGMTSVALTSFVTNVPAKLLTRRARPDIDPVPLVRRLARLPSSSSFPSGHAASAAAFAAGVAMEEPVLGVPVGALAAGVAFSRVYTGVHYPGDVLCGAAVGVAVGAATGRLWPSASQPPARARSNPLPVSQRPAADGAGLRVVVNVGAGPVQLTPHEALRDRLPKAVFEEIDGDGIAAALDRAAAHAVAIGVCGGDGTANAGAAAALRSAKPLFVAPGGTLNRFAAEVGIENVDDAVAALREGELAGVDVGVIAGHPFLNTASIGAYTDLVDARERLEDRIGKWPAVLLALARVLRRARPVDVEIDGRPMRAWMVFIGNCRYRPEAGIAPRSRERLDDGLFDVRIVHAGHRWARLRLLLAVVTGTLHRSESWTKTVSPGPIRVGSLQGPLRLSRDGETFDGPQVFTVEKAGERLAVFVPPSTAQPAAS